MFYVYILNSEKYNRYYVGCSSNWKRRLFEHNNGKVRSTKAYVPWFVIHQEEFSSKSEAFEREKQIKSYKGGNAFKNLIKDSESWQSG